MSQTTAPFLPFTRPEIDEETIQGVVDVLRSGWITTGPQSQKFEAALSEYCGGRPVRAFNSGTCTLEIGLRIAGVGAGDEVITTPASWVSTSNVILETGATPVFADIDPVTRNIDLDKLEQAITPRTKAIIPVFLSGLPVDMDRLYTIARAHKLRVIEDAAQAFGSTWNGKRIGAIGDIVSFSFHANKNLTTIEGGALVLNNEEEATLAQKYRLQGITRTGFDGMDCDVLGGKYNLTDVAARVGPAVAAHRTLHRAAPRACACILRRIRRQCSREARRRPADRRIRERQLAHVPDHVAARAPDDHARRVHGADEGTRHRHGHPLPGDPSFHAVPCTRLQGGHVPHAERYGASTVTLPLFTQMTESDVRRVVDAINQICEQYGK